VTVHLRGPDELVVCVDAGGLQPVSFELLNLHPAELVCNPVLSAREYSLSHEVRKGLPPRVPAPWLCTAHMRQSRTPACTVGASIVQ